MTTTETKTVTAEAMARRCHQGQTDKAGAPCIEHVARVAAAAGKEARPAAWLHDVLEDTTTTSAELIEAGIDPRTVERVATLTRRANESYNDYITRVVSAGDAAAIEVKIADIEDHLGVHPDAISRSHRKRYAQALYRLMSARNARGTRADAPGKRAAPTQGH